MFVGKLLTFEKVYVSTRLVYLCSLGSLLVFKALGIFDWFLVGDQEQKDFELRHFRGFIAPI